MMQRNLLTLIVCLAAGLTACDKKESPAEPSADTNAKKPAAPDHSPEAGSGHHGKPVPLGNTKIGDYDVRAARDEGAMTPGSDSPIDVWLTGDISKVTAVRFWIGTEGGEESIKARADIEDPDEPNHWHTHAEIPDPMPARSQLWVEIETAAGSSMSAFDLKA